MSAPRDKLGEFILVAEEFNRYEEFAASPGNYATVDEGAKAVAAPGKFDLYFEQSGGASAHKDRRVLVRSDHVYGVGRRIARLIFDVFCADSLWVKSKSVTSYDGVVAEGYDASLRARVRPVTAEFDPAAVTWESAYEGESPLTFGDSVEAMLALHGATLSANQQNPYGAATATVSESGNFPALLVFRRDAIDGVPSALDAWNALDAIYGWELSLFADGASESAWWSGGDPTSGVSFVIRA